MLETVIDSVPRIEGDLRVVLAQSDTGSQVFLQSGQSTHLTERIKGRYPLEAPQLTQSLSSNSSVAHAIASVSALEDYLNIYPTDTSLFVRQVMLDLATIRSHIDHFYWHVLPDYLNSDHIGSFSEKELWFYNGYTFKEPGDDDLPKETGARLILSIEQAATTIDLLQKTLTFFGGKFPIVMNQIPGGITNFEIDRSTIMQAVRNLEQCKPFVEEIWPNDVKNLVLSIPETTEVLNKHQNLISFGSLDIEKNRGKTSNYSEGVRLAGKLEPVNELKITESVENTYFLPIDKSFAQNKSNYDFNKPNARTWIKGARYDGEPMLTGALSRMLITHLAGGNLEISDKIGQMIEDLNLTIESPNCIASRLLSEVVESRIYLKNIFRNLFSITDAKETNRRTRFDFSAEGVGIGKIESPGGSLLHQIFIKDNRIRNYRIVSSTNWNYATADEKRQTGEVEYILNTLLQSEGLTPEKANRVIHSYYPLILDGTL